MQKHKCRVCSTIHGGFHLCLGHDTGRETTLVPSHKMKKALVKKPSTPRYEHTRDERWAKYRETVKERDDNIVKLYESGMSMMTISRKTGVAYGSIQTVLRQRKVKMRPRGYNGYQYKEQA